MRNPDVLVIGSIPEPERLFPGWQVLAIPTIADFPSQTLKHLSGDWATDRHRLFGAPLVRSQIGFEGGRTVSINGTTIEPNVLLLAAGSRAVFPEIPGADLLYSVDDLPALKSVPRSVVILGGGSQAAELIHLFERLNCSITIIHRSERLLEGEDSLLSRRFTDIAASRHDLRLRQQVVAAETAPKGRVLVSSEDEYGVEYHCEGDLVVVATGRRPGTRYPGFRESGIEMDPRGYVVVDDYGRTSVPGVYAVGAVTRGWPSAEASMRDWQVIAANITAYLAAGDTGLSGLSHIPSRNHTPYVTGANPPMASVGLSDQTAGFFTSVEVSDELVTVKLLGDPGTGLLLGGHLMGESASALTQPLALAMSRRIPVVELAAEPWVRTPPTATLGRAVRELADALPANS